MKKSKFLTIDQAQLRNTEEWAEKVRLFYLLKDKAEKGGTFRIEILFSDEIGAFSVSVEGTVIRIRDVDPKCYPFEYHSVESGFDSFFGVDDGKGNYSIFNPLDASIEIDYLDKDHLQITR